MCIASKCRPLAAAKMNFKTAETSAFREYTYNFYLPLYLQYYTAIGLKTRDIQINGELCGINKHAWFVESII